jgi:RecB family endonuclease NucS
LCGLCVKTVWRMNVSARRPVIALENPTLADAERLVKDALMQRKALLLVGNCWVEYAGRASSKLEAGERVVMIKNDGSVLVHRASGYEPVNWQPPGSVFQTRVSNDVLEVRTVRRQPRESVHVHFDRVFLVAALSLTDAGEFSLYASEEDMQRAILTEPKLIEDGFKPISYEKHIEPGFVDVYGTDKAGRFVVVEIKRKTAGREAAMQLDRYVKAIRTIVNREVRGILAAPNIAKGVQRLLASLGLDYKAVDPKKCAEISHRMKTKKLAEYFSNDTKGMKS